MSIIVFLFGAFLSIALANRSLNITLTRSAIIYLWHTCWMVAFYFYVSTYGGDALDYYLNAPRIIGPSALGSNVIYISVNTLKEAYGFTFFDCFLVFNIFGAIALNFYDAIFSEFTKREGASHIATTIFIFLPSFSFWTSGIGKDGISVLAIAISLWVMLNMATRWPALIFSAVIAALVRPQVSALIIISLLASALFTRKTPVIIKFIIASFCILLAYYLTPYFLNYISYTDVYGNIVDNRSFIEHINYIQHQNMNGSGASNLAEKNIILILLEYLFSPTIFEMKSLLHIAQGLENSLLLMIFLFLMYQKKKVNQYPASKHLIIYITVLSVTCLLVYAAVSSNIGIAARTKWCVLPLLLSMLLISFRKNERTST
jgi:hypothetical protein